MTRHPTISTVAVEAGVSIATVSRVIRNHPDVSETTRAKVEAVIESLGYKPSRLARALVSDRSYSLGLLVSDITNPFYPQLAKSVEAAAYAAGMRMILCNTADDPERELSYLDELMAHRVDGLILASVTAESALIETALKNNLHLVAVNRPPLDAPINSVVVDNVRGASIAVQHLVDLGHERIAHIGGPEYATNAMRRLAGYKTALEANDIEIDGDLIVTGPFDPLASGRAAKALLGLSDPPTAIFVVNDMQALAVISACVELGYRVPHDISIVGFDDTAIAGSSLLSLTTVSQNIDYVGARAVEILVDLATNSAKNASPEPITEIVEPELIIRRSTSHPRPRPAP